MLSPSAQRIDRFAKHDRYAAAGVAHYWIVDPVVPSVTAYELVGDAYQLVAAVRGIERHEATRPYEISVVPSELVADW